MQTWSNGFHTDIEYFISGHLIPCLNWHVIDIGKECLFKSVQCIVHTVCYFIHVMYTGAYFPKILRAGEYFGDTCTI
jgi:hypothetical protein